MDIPLWLLLGSAALIVVLASSFTALILSDHRQGMKRLGHPNRS
jgi:hypothetical protein